jgi:hypothetical protein
LYVLAIEARCVEARDVDTGMSCTVRADGQLPHYYVRPFAHS